MVGHPEVIAAKPRSHSKSSAIVGAVTIVMPLIFSVPLYLLT